MQSSAVCYRFLSCMCICCLMFKVAYPQKILSQPFVTISPFSLLERDAGPTVGADLVLYERISLTADVQWIGYHFLKNFDERDRGDEITGYRVRPGIRFYTQRHKGKNEGFYMQLSYMYKKTVETNYSTLQVNDPNGNFIYSYAGGFKKRKTVNDFSYKIGGRLFFNENQRTGLDMYAGVGLRKRSFLAYGFPSGATGTAINLPNANIGTINTNKYDTPSFPLGLTFFYFIGKNKKPQ